MPLWAELKRRRVFRVSGAYAVVAWLLMQIAVSVEEPLGLPASFDTAVIVLLILGFPVAVLLAWAYELTPDGIKKEPGATEAAAPSFANGYKFAYLVAGTLLLAAILLFPLWERHDADSRESVQVLMSRPSVLVLPFVNTSSNDSLDDLAFGLWDETIGGLQLIGSFPVVSRSVSIEFSDSTLTANEFAEDFGASYFVEGSVNSDGDSFRVSASLLNGRGGTVWAERFSGDEATGELFDLADELVSRVSAAVLDSEIERIRRTDRPPLDAYERYLSGLRTVWSFDAGEYASARRNLEEAVAIAPDFAEAWWALGELEVINYSSRALAAETVNEDLETILGHFRRAHDLSPFHGAACGCIGYLLSALDRTDEARAVFEQSIEANPLSADLRHNYAIYLLNERDYEEALANIDLAESFGVRRAFRAEAWVVRSIVALANGDELEALDAVNRALFNDDQNPIALVAAIALYYLLGEHERAQSLSDDVMRTYPGITADNPMLSSLVKPIDDILASRRDAGENGGPANVADMLRLLRDGNA